MATFNSTDFLVSGDFNSTVNSLVQGKVFNWISDINISFLLTSGYLVFSMQLGFALLTAGSVRAKSVKSVCLKNIMDAAFGGCAYYLLGWGFAYGDHQTCDDAGVCTDVNNAFIGSNNFAMSLTPDTNFATFYFQYVFAVSTATIVSGAVAERIQFVAYAAYAFFLCAWVYPVLTHWVWSPSGWASPTRTTGPLLFGSGAYDTVGSGAVHMVGGMAALAGAWIAGPRLGRFDANGKPVVMPGHNAVLYMMGVLLLWFGFYGFNPGTMAMIIMPDGTSFGQVVARCAISTTLGACFGGVTALLIYVAYSKITTGHAVWDLISAGNGALMGCIVITSGCAILEPWAAMLGGIVGGVFLLPSSLFFLHVCKIDDPVDAVTVHGTGGALGVLWYALMAKKELVAQLYGALPDGGQRHWGWWMGDYPVALGANVVWVLVIAGWTLGMMIPFFYLLKICGLLRITPHEEEMGVDASHHGGSAFPGLDGVYSRYEGPIKDGNAYANGNGTTDIAVKDKMATLEADLAYLSAKVRKLEGEKEV